MSQRHTATIAAALLLSIGSVAQATEDPIRASFERMFSHEPSYAVATATVADERDPLLHAVTAALGSHWSAYPTPTAQSTRDDQVLASFDRMFGHQPAHLTPTLPQGLGDDPLYAAVVVPLRRQGLYPVGPLHAEIPPPSAQR